MNAARTAPPGPAGATAAGGGPRATGGAEAAGGATTPAGPDGALVIKVVKGTASPAELAALTTVLLARAAALAAVGPCPLESRPVAGWRRPERLAAHRDPRGWRVAGSPAA